MTWLLAVGAFVLGILVGSILRRPQTVEPRAFPHVDIEVERRRAVVKAEPLYEDDEDTEPFDISLQVYGDLPEGRSAASAISFAMTRWLREGAPAGGYTASNELRVHLKCMHGRNRDPESGGEACQ